MPISPATRLGPYEIVSPIGAGGMGEVHRARDTRLNREVAIKILPSDVAGDASRQRRFEQEARAAGALNHPNIVAVHDIGADSGVTFIVSELIEGETLRSLIQRGPVPLRKLLDIAVQTADGLAAAHAAGIVHRDLKPENIMLTREGRVKILDFGLAKEQEESAPASDETERLTVTQPGTILGTVSYMSPEQARGRSLDFRSDQFSFGVILYEMCTGRQAFRRESSVQTLSAIIAEEPPPIDSSVPAPLRWIVECCLAKEPEGRFASTKDLYRDLLNLREHFSEVISGSALTALGPRPSRRRLLIASLAVVVLAAVAAAGILAGKSFWSATPPVYEALTFRRGTIYAARFAPDGQTVVYAASFGEEPVQVYSVRPGSPESTPWSYPNAALLSISPSGELAVSLNVQNTGGFISRGTLARAPLSGAAPRQVLENVEWADWSPDGNHFAVVRETAGRRRIEFPIGKVLYETAGWISDIRVSPKGDRIAFLDHPTGGDDAGSVAVIDMQGRKTVLSEGWLSEAGLAWAPAGDEIWFTATRTGGNRSINAVTLSGKERLVALPPGGFTLHDVARDGRALLTRDNARMGIMSLAYPETRERELSWLDWSLLRDISRDGKTILFDETGEGGGPEHGVYIRRTDGSPAVRLGDGIALSLSPDGKWAAAIQDRPSRQIVLLPTGPGQPKPLSLAAGYYPHFAFFFPSGRRLLLWANEPDHGTRMYVVDISEDFTIGKPRPIAPEGVGTHAAAISPDGKFVAAKDSGNALILFPVDGGEAHRIKGATDGDDPAAWTESGDILYVFQRTKGQVYRIALSSGHRELWKELTPRDRTGLMTLSGFSVTKDGKSYAYSTFISLSELYLVKGLK